MTTADQLAPLDPAVAAPMPVGSRLIGAIAVGIALLSATATFLVLSGLTPIAPVHEVVVKLLLGNAATGLLLLAIIGREVWIVVQARRRGYAGSRLHVQIVGLFAVIAAVPTVLVAVVASTTLDRGARPLLLDAHPRHDRAIADRRQRLCDRACPGDPRRDHGDGLRSRPRQADVRFQTAINSANSSPRRRPPGAASPRP